MTARRITVAGAGILGLWQASTLARRGHAVRLVERSAVPFAGSASALAGALISPDCESEAAGDIVREAGRDGLGIWRATYPRLVNAGSLVVAGARDQGELVRFGRATVGHRTLDADGIGRLEPDLAGRYASGLFYADEAHMNAPDALAFLLEAVRDAGVTIALGSAWSGPEDDDAEITVDCRGLAARGDLPNLRGVRGERLLIETRDIALARPVRLLHPRQPLYVVPWDAGRFLIGATVIESEDPGPVTVRSTLELLGAAYALHPGFAEARVLEASAGVRPAFPDNIPRAIVRAGGRRILVNGAFRHGFLLAPVLARAVADFLADGAKHPLLIEE